MSSQAFPIVWRSTCVSRAIKVADWNIPHQYRFYALAVLATYAGPPGTPPDVGPDPAPGP